jgi:hypothetical protein
MQLYPYADLTIASTFPLVELRAAKNKSEGLSPDLTLYLFDSPPKEPAQNDVIRHWRTGDQSIALSLFRQGQGFLLRFPFLADFVIDESGCRIGAWPAPETDEETLRHLLLDQVLPRVLGYQGRLVLHASAVCVDGQVLAFMGETGKGKSTLAASFHAAGFHLLTDDGLVVTAGDSGSLALPVYPGLRLWPQSMNALFAEPPVSTVMASCSGKNRVLLTDNRENESGELAAIYILAEPDSGNETSTVTVLPLSARASCIDLVRNSFQLDVSDHKQAKSLFATASAVAERVPVFSLSYPRDFSCLPAVHDVILQQHRLLASEPAHAGVSNR